LNSPRPTFDSPYSPLVQSSNRRLGSLPLIALAFAFPIHSGLAFSSAQPKPAAQLEVTWNSRGMPESLQVPDAVSLEPRLYTLEYNTADRFMRNIVAVRRLFLHTERIPIVSSDPIFLSQPMDTHLREAIQQIENGGNEFLPESEQAPAAYLAAHPIANFDRQAGLDLSERFGVGFTANLYIAWDHARAPEDVAAEARLSQTDRLNGLSARAPAQRLYLLSPGFSVGDPEATIGSDQPRIEARIISSLRALGFSAEGVANEAFGTVEKNAATFEARLRQRLLDGKHIVLIAVSKGVPEMLTALAHVRSAPDPGTTGTVDGVISLSSLYRGSFVTDWVSSNPDLVWASGIAEYLKALLGDYSDILEECSHLTHAVITPLVDQALAQIGSIPAWVDVTALPAENGLANNKHMRMLQEQIVARYIAAYGPSDGVIEPMDTLLPTTYPGSTRHARVFVRGSHNIFDGSAGPFDLGTEEDMREWVGGLSALIEDTE